MRKQAKGKEEAQAMDEMIGNSPIQSAAQGYFLFPFIVFVVILACQKIDCDIIPNISSSSGDYYIVQKTAN